MADISIQLFSTELQTSVDDVILKFLNIGIVKTEIDVVSSSERDMFLSYIKDIENNIHDNELIIQRKTCSTLNVFSISGKNKRVYVEVRKKRTYIKTIKSINSNLSQNNVVDSTIKVSDVTKKNLLQKEKTLCTNKVDKTSDSFFSTHQVSKKNNYVHQTSILFDKKSKKVFTSDVISSKNKKWLDEIQILGKKKNKDFSKENSHNDLKGCFATNEDYRKSYHLSVIDSKNNNDRRNRSRIRSRHRFENEIIKHKKNSIYHHIYHSMLDRSDQEHVVSHVSNRLTNKSKGKQSVLIQSFNKPVRLIPKRIIIGETIAVLDLASKLSVKSSYIIKFMMQLGLTVTVNQKIDQETAQLVISEMGHNAIVRCENELETLVMHDRNVNINNSNLSLMNRNPIVTIMGHVDHGKTSLLDYIRSTKIKDSEIGGITQSIGAYRVNTQNGIITFLDTPGHEAFSAMRTRGIQLTDIVILVVAADDGVMPQTIEAIEHIKLCNIPVVVAINKIDKPESNPERIKHELSSYGLVPEDWGGSIQFINISATTGNGINSLLEAVLLQAEILELKAVHFGMANAIVIDAYVDKGHGPVVSILVREGTLKCGDIILCGMQYGRVRAMCDENGCKIESAGPSTPVQLLGLSGIPNSGEVAMVVRDEKKARAVALYRQSKYRDKKLIRNQDCNVDNLFRNIKNFSVVPELNLIIKANTQGSVEAVQEMLSKLSDTKTVINIISSSVGIITETDVNLAVTSQAIILGFNVKIDPAARRVILLEQVDVCCYSIIYDLLNAVKAMTFKILPSKDNSEIVGVAEVRSVFYVPYCGKIAGCLVTKGIVQYKNKIRVVRKNIVIYNGKLESLRHFKQDVHEVKNGSECGIRIKNYDDICIGDFIEVLDVIKLVK